MSTVELTPCSIRGVVFDCDGVMINSEVINMEYYNCVRKYFGLPKMTPEEEHYSQMATSEQALLHIIPPEHHKDLERVCKTELVYRDFVLRIPLMPGFLDFVTWLHGQGVRMSIFTNRTRPGLDYVFQTFSLPDVFDPVITSDVTAPKPAPDGLDKIREHWGVERHEILFVGDSTLDEMAAGSAGVPFAAFGRQRISGVVHAVKFEELRGVLAPFLRPAE